MTVCSCLLAAAASFTSVTGVVQSVDRNASGPTSMRLLVEPLDGGSAEIVEARGSYSEWKGNIDSVVALGGEKRPMLNPRGEEFGHFIMADSVSVISRGNAEDPFSAPPVPLGDIWSGAAPQRMRKVRGVVTWAYVSSGLFLQDGDGSVFVRYPEAFELEPGDVAEAVGFARMAGGVGNIIGVAVRKVGVGSMPPSVETDAESLWGRTGGPEPSPYGRIVTVTARLVRYNEETPQKHVFACEAQGLRMYMMYRGDVPEELVSLASLNALVRVTGVCDMTFKSVGSSGGLPKIGDVRILIRDASDVEVLPDSAYESRRMKARLASLGLWTLAVALAALAAAAVKLVMYKVRINRLNAVQADRKRMAADMHDTMEQHLSGATMLITSVVDDLRSGSPEGCAEMLENVAKILLNAKTEMREAIWNMRHDDVFDGRPEDVMRKLAERLTKSGVVRVRCLFRGLPDHLPPPLFSAILFIGQEAVTNAVKHGKAKNVLVASDPIDGGFKLRFANDGAPLGNGVVLGPEAGHFGLSGMRDRARHAGIDLAAGDVDGMFTVTLTVKESVYAG